MQPFEHVSAAVVAALRRAGAVFALAVDDSRPVGGGRPSVAAWWPDGLESTLPADVLGEVEVVDLNRAPIHIAGPIAMADVVLFDDDPGARVDWVAFTRKVWLDELWRRQPPEARD